MVQRNATWVIEEPFDHQKYFPDRAKLRGAVLEADGIDRW
jgi:hypothetical protein